MKLTAHIAGDAEFLPNLLQQLDPWEMLASVAAGSSNDAAPSHQAIRKRNAKALIPSRAGAVAWPANEDGITHSRMVILRACTEQGEAKCERTSDCHRRSLTKTAMFRIKALFSQKLKNQNFTVQQAEAYCCVGVL
jgi:hypothetical protein